MRPSMSVTCARRTASSSRWAQRATPNASTASSPRSRRSADADARDDPELVEQAEERGRVGRPGRPFAQAVPVDLLAHGAGDLEQRAEVEVVLVERVELRV